jgi:hypothetical protein
MTMIGHTPGRAPRGLYNRHVEPWRTKKILLRYMSMAPCTEHGTEYGVYQCLGGSGMKVDW